MSRNLYIIKKLKGDAFRYIGCDSEKNIIELYMKNPGFRFMFWHRIVHNMRKRGKILYCFPWFVLSRLKYKFGYDIPAETNIGNGFYIGHFGSIVVSPKAKIGNNVNISQGVTIGNNPRGAKKRYPTIGNNVYIGPGLKLSEIFQSGIMPR